MILGFVLVCAAAAFRATRWGSGDDSAVRIFCIGDSITQGVTAGLQHEGQHPDEGTSSFRRPLYFVLRHLLPAIRVTFVGPQTAAHRGPPPSDDFPLAHAAHWGSTALELVPRVRGFILSDRPDVVVVWLGANDIFTANDGDLPDDAACVSLLGAALVDAAIMSSSHTTLTQRQGQVVKYAVNNVLCVVKEALGAIEASDYSSAPRSIVLCRLLPHEWDASMPLFELFNAALDGLSRCTDGTLNLQQFCEILGLQSMATRFPLTIRIAATDIGIHPVHHLYDRLHPNAEGEVAVAANMVPAIYAAVDAVAWHRRTFRE